MGKQEKKRIYKTEPQTIKKMVIATYISIITLKVNGNHTKDRNKMCNKALKQILSHQLSENEKNKKQKNLKNSNFSDDPLL